MNYVAEVSSHEAERPTVWERAYICFTVHNFFNVYHFVCDSFSFGFEDGMWDLIVLIS